MMGELGKDWLGGGGGHGAVPVNICFTRAQSVPQYTAGRERW
jgi:hypothetical protein